MKKKPTYQDNRWEEIVKIRVETNEIEIKINERKESKKGKTFLFEKTGKPLAKLTKRKRDKRSKLIKLEIEIKTVQQALRTFRQS